jgi:methionyl-tRNA formyltransferase
MKFVFVGNRKFVLEEMLRMDLQVEVLVIKETHLQRDPLLKDIPHTTISSKTQLLEELDSQNFDVLISNGCPYILPISKMRKRTYINIHPSFLPDLRGIDPVLGAILFKRDTGATCHVMADEIDTGDIITRIKIPYSEDLDVSLLYQLSFIAEKRVFIDGLKKEFIPSCKQEEREDLIYYSRKPEDQIIMFDESNDQIAAKIQTFSNRSQGCSFMYRGQEFKVYGIEVMYNDFLIKHSISFEDLKIILCYEDCIIIKKDGELIKLDKVIGPLERIQVNSYINEVM